MDKREWKICVWIHHIATFTGLITGIAELVCNRRNALKESLLGVYIISQLWAAIKIIASVKSGKERLKDSYDKIQNLWEEDQARDVVWLLTVLSGIFKTGIPVLLR